MNKATETVKKQIEEILNNRETELKTLQDAVEADQKAIEKAGEDMNEATTSSDLKAYRAAKTRLAEAQDALEMHTTRRDALKEKPLISEDKYKNMVNSIFKEIDDLDAQTQKTLLDLTNKMDEAGTKLLEEMNDANKVLARLQRDIYRDADRKVRGKNAIPLPSEDKRVNKYSTYYWSQAPKEQEAYKAAAKVKELRFIRG